MARPARKKKDIERSALELFVEKGVDGTSIRDIAQRAGVTEGALYRHHASKDDLVRALFFESYAGFARLIDTLRSEDEPLRTLIPKLVRAFFQFYDDDPDVFLFVILVRHKLLEEVRSDETNPVEVFSRMMQAAHDRDEIPRQDVNLLTQLLLGMVLQVPLAAHYGRIKTPLLPLADEVGRRCLLVCGIKK